MSEKGDREEPSSVSELTSGESASSARMRSGETSSKKGASSGRRDQSAIGVSEPAVIENEQLVILGHCLIPKKGREGGIGEGVYLKLKNTSGSLIGRAVIEVLFYDVNGNAFNLVEFHTGCIERDEIKNLPIVSPLAESTDVRSYDVKVAEVVLTPAPVARGNDDIEIVRHSFRSVEGPWGEMPVNCGNSIELAVRNVSAKTIATAVFEAVFYDREGNVMDTVRQEEFEIKPNVVNGFVICSDKIQTDMDSAMSYSVALADTRTADVEKVQLRRSCVERLSAGVEEISGLLKNISDSRLDAGVAVTCRDGKGEEIVRRVLYIRDMDPGCFRKFNLAVTVPDGEVIESRTFDVGEIAEGLITDASGWIGSNEG